MGRTTNPISNLCSAVFSLIWLFFFYKYSNPALSGSCYADKVDGAWTHVDDPTLATPGMEDVSTKMAAWCFWGFVLCSISAATNIFMVLIPRISVKLFISMLQLILMFSLANLLASLVWFIWGLFIYYGGAANTCNDHLQGASSVMFWFYTLTWIFFGLGCCIGCCAVIVAAAIK